MSNKGNRGTKTQRLNPNTNLDMNNITKLPFGRRGEASKPTETREDGEDTEQEDLSSSAESADATSYMPEELFTEPKFTEVIEATETSEVGGMPTREWLKQTFKTKSACIRYLVEQGYKPKDIAEHMKIRQQHVRNVMSQDLKRGPMELYVEVAASCSHNKSGRPMVDVLLRKSNKDTNQSRILYRVCVDCALNIIPGVTKETLHKHLPGVNNDNK